jgi:hypothetical protein
MRPSTGHAEGTTEKPLAPIKEEEMKLIETLKTAAANRAVYRATRDEIARMPRDVALDLGIFPEDAHQIAWAAVYGK